MLDSNPSKPSRENIPDGNGITSSTTRAGFVTSPSTKPGQAVSPPYLSQGNSLFTERSSSPDRYKVYQSQTARPFRSYSGGLGQRPPHSAQPDSPETPRNGTLSGTQTSQHSPIFSFGNNKGWPLQESRRLPDGRVVNRPSSQPSGHRSPPRVLDGRTTVGNSDRSRPNQDTRKRQTGQDQRSKFEEREPGDRVHLDTKHSQNQESQVPGPHDLHVVTQLSPKQERTNESDYAFVARVTQSHNQHPSQRTESVHSSVKQALDKESQLSNNHQSPFSPETLRRLQKERHVVHQRNPIQSPSKYARAPAVTDDRQALALPEDSAPFPGSMEMPKDTDVTDQQHFRDDINGHRKSSLAMLMDSSRRAGRFSPLPQAVQGVQGRTSGPASDPGIKNEFARMFSGIGSGVGSAGPTGSGTSTPFAPPSPTMSHEHRPTPLNPRGELSLGKPVASSKGGKRSRKVRDDESKAEPADGDAVSTKAVKRSRQNHHHSHLVHQ